MYTVKAVSNQLTEVRMRYKAGFKQKFLLVSDLHIDNPKCDRKLLFKTFDRAKEEGAGILVNGDLFCLMQGRNDRRGNKSSIRKEHQKSTYFDAVFKETAEILSPWASQFVMFGNGNHETAIIRHNEIDPLGNLCFRLNHQYDANVQHMPYQGVTKFVFEKENGGGIRTKFLFHHHGKFGGMVSKGVQSVLRYAAAVPQANYVWTGHNHERWAVEQTQYFYNRSGKPILESQWHFNTATFKQEFGEGDGFAIEKVVLPKPLGGIWLEFEVDGGGQVFENISFTRNR